MARSKKSLLRIEKICGHINTVFSLALDLVFCRRKALPKMSASHRCLRQRFANHSRALGRVLLGTSASPFGDFPRSPMARIPAKSRLQ